MKPAPLANSTWRMRISMHPIEGMVLHEIGYQDGDRLRPIIYRASQHDCVGCPMKQQCCPNVPNRKITRSVHERSRDVAREIAKTTQYK